MARRVAGALVSGSWTRFRKDAAPWITIEEHWNAYDDYFVAKQRGEAGKLGVPDWKAVSYLTSVDAGKRLPRGRAKIFRAFCGLVRNSKAGWSSGWGPWPTVEGRCRPVGLDFGFAHGPCAYCKVASNLYWCVEFESSAGRWRASKLIIVGH